MKPSKETIKYDMRSTSWGDHRLTQIETNLSSKNYVLGIRFTFDNGFDEFESEWGDLSGNNLSSVYIDDSMRKIRFYF